MHKPWWYATQGAVKVPAGLILAAKDGIDLGTDWSVWTAANGKFLRGTTSDSWVGTVGSRSGLSLASTYSGGHAIGSTRILTADKGLYGNNTGKDYAYPSNNPNKVGSHGHTVYITYRPPYAQTRLIQAQNDAPVPLGALMFADSAHADQSLYTALTNNRCFRAGTGVSQAGASQGISNISNVSDAHHHYSYTTWTASGVGAAGYPTDVSSGGGSHDHGDAGSISVNHNIGRYLLRLYSIIDQKKIKGLIGMWAQTGAIPDKWEIVAAANARYIYFNSGALGQIAGSNTVSISGSTNSSSHRHSGQGSSSGWVYLNHMHHSDNVSHYHTFSGTKTYYPERYHIKFIRYVG